MVVKVGVFTDEEFDPRPTEGVDGETYYVVEVLREHRDPEEVTIGTSFVEVAEPGGTLVNVGAGPQLPPNPYEGQVWILT